MTPLIQDVISTVADVVCGFFLLILAWYVLRYFNPQAQMVAAVAAMTKGEDTTGNNPNMAVQSNAGMPMVAIPTMAAYMSYNVPFARVDSYNPS